ncbi:MAG: class I SAM-dependent methyltransferase [Woeseiaceae bacterium]
MSLQEIVENDLVQEDSSVWVLSEHSEFGYSDGVESERYLEKVFRGAKDLSSGSCELESHIKDWPSEYHLSTRRAQLFAGFDFDPSLKVLEVGCGCGAITRYLGERFHDVVSVEGSIKRARLARLRTNELESVSVICAPFQEIRFSRKFDIIFCVGVYEYSASFVDGEDPYDSVLDYFSEMMTPNGIVVIAIENQFGLKYFNSSREDHTGSSYDGLEGYHADRKKVRTFGKIELENNLRRHFSNVEMFYPYPDYKLPNCVVSDEFLSSATAGEMISQIKSRDYYGAMRRPWDESLVSIELSRNELLPVFSNSFLAFAGKSEMAGVSFPQLAAMVSFDRIDKFRTQTRIYFAETGDAVVSKSLLSGDKQADLGKLSLHESRSNWQDSYSLQTRIYQNCMSNVKQLGEMFAPCRVWLDFLEDQSEIVDGEKYVDGSLIDCNFANAYLRSGKIVLVDNEWRWKERIRVNVIVIRAIFTFLLRIDDTRRLPEILQVRSYRRLISRIAESIGVNLSKNDFSRFVELESEFQSLVSNSNQQRNSRMCRWILADKPSLFAVRSLRAVWVKFALRLKRAIARLH